LFIIFFNEPKKFKGGDISLTNSPVADGILLEEKPQITTLTIKNNMGIVFSSHVSHRVEMTKSAKQFKDGRFSMNCWVGFMNNSRR